MLKIQSIRDDDLDIDEMYNAHSTTTEDIEKLPKAFDSSDDLFGTEFKEEDFTPIFPFQKKDSAVGSPHLSQLERVKSNLEKLRAAPYLVDFEKEIHQHAITVCSVDAEEIEKRRAELSEQFLKMKEELERRHEKGVRLVQKAEENTIKRIQNWFQQKEEERLLREKQMKKIHEMYRNALGKTFQEATKQFKIQIEKRKEYVNSNFGKIIGKEEKIVKPMVESWKWSKVPQQIQLHIRCIRGVKDKLPKGKYVLFVTLRDRIGGRIVSKKGKKAKDGKLGVGEVGMTLEVKHKGCFNDVEMNFEQTLYLVSPPKQNRKPYMIFSFELVQTAGKYKGICCAWGAFPVEDSKFQIISGKYKLPLIRGSVDNNVDQYHKAHNILTEDLDKWMGNLYFEVKPLPRILNGVREDDAQLEHLRELTDIKIDSFHKPQLLDEETSDDSEDEEDESDESEDERLTFDDSHQTNSKLREHELFNEWKILLQHQKARYINEAVQSEKNLDNYRYELPQPTGHKESMFSIKQGIYLAKATFTDMGLIWSLETFINADLYVALFLFILCFFGRIHIHYVSQWLYLLLIGMSGIRYEPMVISVLLSYAQNAMSFFEETCVVLMGPFGNLITFIIFIIITWLFQKLKFNIPRIGHKFLVVFGICTIMDPFFILFIDICYQRWQTGDAFKLFAHMGNRPDGNVVMGILITMTLYVYHVIVSFFILYNFLLRIFMNGQIIDVFERVHGNADSFFVPHDLEVSKQEFLYVCKKSQRYRGSNGEFRRTVILEYILHDPSDPEFEEITYHIIFYTLTPKEGEKPKRRIFRQFLQLHDGTLLEVFGDEDAISVLNSQMRVVSTASILEEIAEKEDSMTPNLEKPDEKNENMPSILKKLEKDGTSIIHQKDTTMEPIIATEIIRLDDDDEAL